MCMKLHEGLSVNISQYSLWFSYLSLYIPSQTLQIEPLTYTSLPQSKDLTHHGRNPQCFFPADHRDQKNATPEVPVPIRLLHISIRAWRVWFCGSVEYKETLWLELLGNVPLKAVPIDLPACCFSLMAIMSISWVPKHWKTQWIMTVDRAPFIEIRKD